MRRVLPLLLAAACAPEPEPTASCVVPLDGYTGWPDDEPVTVFAPDLDVPVDYEVRDAIRVVDLTDGGYVRGAFEVFEDHVRFDPEHDWLRGRRYAWTLDVPASVPHGPEWGFAERLAGTAVFDTNPSLEVLDAGLLEDGTTCLVLSALAPSPKFEVRLSVDDEEAGEVELSVLPTDDWAPDLLDAGLEPAVDVACLPPDRALAAGARARVWLDDSGPWFAEVSEAPPEDLVAARHRFVPADAEEAGDDADTGDSEDPDDTGEAP